MKNFKLIGRGTMSSPGTVFFWRLVSHYAKRGVLGAMCSLGAVFFWAGAAQATPLAPGGFLSPAPAEPDPIGGSVLYTTSVGWGPSLSGLGGTLTSSVLTGDASNPYGGLTFTYQFNIAPVATDSASGIALGGFAGFLTDVSFRLASGVAPTYVTRSGSGDDVTFNFFTPDVVPGQSSALLVVQTDAHSWKHGITSIIDHSAVPNIGTLIPAVPDAANTGWLLCIGLCALAFFGRTEVQTARAAAKRTER
ncbi:MAG: hypothetical protein KGJ88_10220 [Verrucomicrobiota bacterium]|nr:hypothetical protein [Verrucomicrobiota bacterium]